MNEKQNQKKEAYQIAFTYSNKDLSVDELIENAKLIESYIFGEDKECGVISAKAETDINFGFRNFLFI